MFFQPKILFFIVVFVTIQGCAALKASIYQDEEFSHLRSNEPVRPPVPGPVEVVELEGEEHFEALLKQGYKEFGRYKVERTIKICHKKSDCDEIEYDLSTRDVILEEAPKRGAELVIFFPKEKKAPKKLVTQGECAQFVWTGAYSVCTKWHTNTSTMYGIVHEGRFFAKY